MQENERGKILLESGTNEMCIRDRKTDEGMFTATGGQPQLAANTVIHHGMIERANTDLVQQMAEMITCQRALQSASQMSKMYDQIMSKTATELGRV